MRFETSYKEEGELTISLTNESKNFFRNSLVIYINDKQVGHLDNIPISPESKFSFTINIKLDNNDNFIKVRYGELVFTEKIIVPECKVACKLEKGCIIIYNPYDNPEVKNLVVRVYFWDSDIQEFIIESIKPGTGKELVHKFKRTVSEITIDGERVLKTY